MCASRSAFRASRVCLYGFIFNVILSTKLPNRMRPRKATRSFRPRKNLAGTAGAQPRGKGKDRAMGRDDHRENDGCSLASKGKCPAVSDAPTARVYWPSPRTCTWEIVGRKAV